MKTINYIIGDATNPQTEGNKIIVHICNDIGGWGKGFVMALSRKWPEPEQRYREWHKSQEGFELGAVQFVQVANDLWIANLIGQHKIRKDENGNPPIRYDAVAKGLTQVAEKAVSLNASVHMPRIGCGLAGGKWEHIEPLIMDSLIASKVGTTVYDFG
ncbi:macro domain-containing protein [Aureisphaera galaxeae]|uniref:macro domain-containing protein n=1 Tax=Aureisphaera galaxeae TaxID=1538023 RepID=UPI002350A566|nr:macro domain-containing protein [Aureisphaera galaxeae]MDC8003068.1 macro domain-containing protein [Aureisphaera galaxeae]